jgi:hypothetical protein
MCQFPSLTFIVIIIVIIFIVIIFWAHLTAMKGQIFTQHFKWFQNQHLHINLLLLLQKTCECVSYWGQLIHKNAEFPSQGQTGKESKAELLSLQRALWFFKLFSKLQHPWVDRAGSVAHFEEENRTRSGQEPLRSSEASLDRPHPPIQSFQPIPSYVRKEKVNIFT